MIAITNKTPERLVCTYEVAINRTVVATFEHRRSEGLATCLRKAADAVEAARAKARARAVDNFMQEQERIDRRRR